MSRNFDLQEVGDVNWLLENFQFNSLIRSIDELVILDVSRGVPNHKLFFDTVDIISKEAFMPLSLGGRINSEDEAELYFKNGADKVVINSLYFTNPKEVLKIIKRYGLQSITCSVDYKLIEGSKTVLTNNGSYNTGIELNNYISEIKKIGFGDLIINSIDRDGLGYGYDFDTINEIFSITNSPIVASGGAENEEKLYDGIIKEYISAANTTNIFNFVFDGLKDAREHILSKGVDLPNWNYNLLDEPNN